MANLIENDKGFLVIKCRTTELMTLERGVMGVCDYCNEATLDGYICCALGHKYYCENVIKIGCQEQYIMKKIYLMKQVFMLITIVDL